MKEPDRAFIRDLPSGTYIELVASLCDTRMPAIIMSLMFVAIGAFAMRAAQDGLLTVLVALGTLASAARLIVLLRGRQHCARPDFSLDDATRFERQFALTYCAFACIFGLFAARALALPLVEWQMPVSIAVVGYAAGAAATIALRPRIVVSSLLLSVLPPSGVLLFRADTSTLVSAAALLALLAGGLRSLSKRYVSQSTKATSRRDYARQAQTDHLTGVGNRLALANAFDACRTAGRGNRVALHYVDLDDFKAINDQLGHQVGDRILKLVAEKLRGCSRPDDAVVRLGGDEFVLLQNDADSDEEVEQYATRIARALNALYRVDALSVSVRASVGSGRGSDYIQSVEALLTRADAVLRQRKIERKIRASRPLLKEADWSIVSSQQPEAERLLANSEAEVRSQLLLLGIAKMTWEAAPDGVVEVDSPTWRDYTGQSYDDWKGFGWLTAIHPEDRQVIKATWRDAVRNGRSVHAEYRLKRYDGFYRWMSVHAVPLRNEDGSIARWLGVNIEIENSRRVGQS